MNNSRYFISFRYAGARESSLGILEFTLAEKKPLD